MRRWAWWMGLTLACGPAVPVDTMGEGSAGVGSADTGLPPLTSATAPTTATTATTAAADDLTTEAPPPPGIFDISGGVTTGPVDDPCATGWDVQPLPPAVVFVVDVSGSMVAHTVDHDANPATEPTTRWFALWTALQDQLLAWDPTHHLGLRTFPSATAMAALPPDPLACDSDGSAVVPMPSGAMLVLDTLPPPDDTTLGGAAPLRAALGEALALLSAVDSGRQRFMVLITDGAPNCAPEDMPPELFDAVDPQVEAMIASAAQAGTPTAVIALDVADAPGPGGDGEPIANPTVVLDALAVAGGMGTQAMAADDVPTLQSLLPLVRESMVSVRLKIPDAGLSFGWLEVVIGGEVYQEIADCQTGTGFVYAGDRWDTLQMCGEAAGALLRAGHATIWPICVFPE